jgi:hypothetical protein
MDDLNHEGDGEDAPGTGAADRARSALPAEQDAPRGALLTDDETSDAPAVDRMDAAEDGTPTDGEEPGASVPAPLDPGDRVSIDDPEHSAHDWVTWVSWLLVGALSVFVFVSLSPQSILSNSTATGGDMGAHVWGPRFLMDHLLPEFRLTGWTQDWYAGFPAYVFYMVVPSLIVVWLAAGPPLWLSPFLLAALALAVWKGAPRVTAWWARTPMWVATVFLAVLAVPIPYNVAFKLVTVSGLVTLPIAVFVLGRAARVPFPGPPIMAVASLFFIYDKGFTILGGNGASTMAGEFAFSISLTLSLLYLAVAFRGMRTGRHRALGAVLFGLTILCHLIPAIFAFIVTVVLVFVRREDRTPWWDANRAGRVVATAMIALTLLVLVPGDRVPVLGDLIDRVLPQWLFPAVASIVALALFTGFEPRILAYWRTAKGRVVGAGAALIAAGVVVLLLAADVIELSNWTRALLLVAVVLGVFAGWDSRLVRWAALVGPVGFLLAAFWFVPFYGNSTYMNDMGWEKYTRYTDYLLASPELDSGGMPYRNLVFALAGLGVLLVLIHRVRFGYFMALTVLAFAWIFRFFPQYRLWNARLLPFYYLAIYLLAALAVALVIRSVVIAAQELLRRREEPAGVAVGGAVLVAVFGLVALAGAMSWLPGGQAMADPDQPSRTIYRWGPLDFDTTIVHSWAAWNYAGLEGKPAYSEFSGMIDMMSAVGDEHGCGRAMWEYESDLQRFGTPMAPMLLPYFTDGCIGSMEGLYFESSSTTPFHFLNQSELSTGPSRAQRDLPYSAFDIERGVSHLQLMGIKYYMATTPEAVAAARTDDRLTEVADETFLYSELDGSTVEQNWVVFDVADADIVSALPNQPVVLSDADDHIDGWVYEPDPPEAVEGQPKPPKAAGPAVTWYNDPTRWDVLLATSGPEEWARVASTATDVPVQGNPEVEVSKIDVGSDSVSFQVDRVGVPVLVKVSYFPNWKVDGAEGPYRVTPNFMVVVPTEEQVTLTYGTTSIDLVGWLLTIIGMVAVAGLAVLDHRRRPGAAAVGAGEHPIDGDPSVGDPSDGDPTDRGTIDGETIDGDPALDGPVADDRVGDDTQDPAEPVGGVPTG